MKKVVALSQYEKRVKKLLTMEERAAMEAAIAIDPLAFPVIPGAGGCRKARWGRGSSGKSGGVRMIFYFYVSGDIVYFITIYPKNEKENLTRAEKRELEKLAKEIERQKKG